MNNAYGYSPTGIIKNFKCLRNITLWAGGFGVVQSLIWIALTITAIISYNCLISIDNKLTYGSLMQTVFLDLYFKGNCNPNGYEGYNGTMLKFVPTVLDSEQILIWVCVYLAISVCWLLASVLILTHIKKDNIKLTCGILWTWVFFTFAISAMDLSLGVIFGVDYGRFNIAAYGFNLNSANAGAIDPNAAQLVAGMVAAISLMIISFKGFVLWIINVGLMICLMLRSIAIATDKDGNDTLFMPRKESDDILSTRPPINAFEEPKSNGAFNDAFVPDDRSVGTIELNQESIARAARMSTDSALQDRRFRNLDAFQQYPPPRYNNNKGEPTIQTQDTQITATIAVAAFPAPDYSPPMSRANQRNQRYQ